MEEKKVTDIEYSRNEVPQDQKKSWVNLSIVWAGIIFTVLSMTTGGGLAEGLNFKNVLLASFLGTGFLTVIAILLSILACKTGLTFGLMTNYAFGREGSKFVTALIPVFNIGWFIIIAATFGHFIALALGLGPVGESVCMIVGTLAMGVMALYGFKALTIMSYISIPIIIILCVFVSYRSVDTMGGMQAVWSYVPAEAMTVSAAVTAVIGTWISGVGGGIANFTRFAKNTRGAVLTCIFGMFAANMIMLICGALTAMGMQNGDIPAVLVGLGLVIPGAVLMMANTFTSNVGSLYNTTLSLANSLPFKREKMLIVIVLASAVLTIFRPNNLDFVFTVLNVFGIVLTPFTGIMIADYYFVHRMKYQKYSNATFCRFNPWAYAAWGLSIVLALLIPIGNRAVNGMLIGVAVYTLLMKATGFKAVE